MWRLSISRREPPPPEPKTTPISSRLAALISMPLCASAFFAAATPRTTFLSVRRTSLKFIQAAGSKSWTSPETWHSYGAGSQ